MVLTFSQNKIEKSHKLFVQVINDGFKSDSYHIVDVISGCEFGHLEARIQNTTKMCFCS